MTERVRARVVINGVVQGVSFRWYLMQGARAAGVGGWVRNRPDGAVEAVFEGKEENVRALAEWCKEGPRHARVSSVDIDWEEPEGLAEFDIEG